MVVVVWNRTKNDVDLSRYIVLPKDFEKGYKNNIKKDETEHEFYK